LEEIKDSPVELLFKRAIRKPKAQDPEASHRHGPPPMRNTVRPGETVRLPGRYLSSTNSWLRKQRFGPFYLTVWEKDGFAGEFRAVFESVRPAVFAGKTTEVVFAPKPPPWDRRGTMRVVHPTDREIASGSLGGRSYEPHIEVEVDVPDLGPGMYRLRAEVDKAGTRYLWCRLKEGSRNLEFEGDVPMLPGRQKITLSMPDLPQVTSAELDLNIVLPSNTPSRESIHNKQRDIQKRRQSEPAADSSELTRSYHHASLSITCSDVATDFLNRGEFSMAKDYLDQAMGHLERVNPRYISSAVDGGSLLTRMAIVAYFTNSAGEVRKNLTALADYYEASAAKSITVGTEAHVRKASSLRLDAAECYWKMADQLLMLGVCDPAEAAAVWRRGQSYWKKTSYSARGEDHKKPGWWPE